MNIYGNTISVRSSQDVMNFSNNTKKTIDHEKEWQKWVAAVPAGNGEKRDIALVALRLCLDPQNTFLDLSELNLSDLPALPESVTYLVLANNNLTHLPVLPAKLHALHITENPLQTLPALPDSLTILNIAKTQITSLPASLPSSLRLLIYHSNPGLILREDLPPHVEKIDDNYISTYPHLIKNTSRIAGQ